MIQSILNKIGYISKDESDKKLRAVELMYEEKIESHKKTIGTLNAHLKASEIEVEELQKKLTRIPLVDITIHDPVPTKEDERKAYVAEVSGFHKKILEPKINHMISVAHTLFEETNSDRDYDLILKGVVYSFREFLKWGNAMISEHMAYNTEIPEEKTPEQRLTEEINKITS